MQDTQEMIINAAKELFAQEGFESVSMSMIAKACQKNKATIYHYFESKQALYNEILTLYLNAFLIQIGKSTLPLPDAHEQIYAYIKLLVHLDPLMSRILYRQVLEGGRHLSEEVMRLFEQQRKSFFAIFKSGIVSGTLKMMDPSLIYEMIMGTVLRYKLNQGESIEKNSEQFMSELYAIVKPLISQ